MARAAGLLGEGQRITHAKIFKRAKSLSAYGRFGTDLDQGVSGCGHWRLSAASRTNGCTGLIASNTFSRPIFHRTDGASFFATVTFFYPPMKTGQHALLS
jgi:hypothetical protein